MLGSSSNIDERAGPITSPLTRIVGSAQARLLSSVTTRLISAPKVVLTSREVGAPVTVLVPTEERPVVDKEAVAVERVRLGVETDTDTVAGEVREEEIELDDPTRTQQRHR